MTQSVLTMMGVTFMLVGIVTTGLVLSKLLLAIRSKRWPFVMGQLQQAGIKQVEYLGREPYGGPDYARMEALDFSYTYEVDGQQFEGYRVTFSDHASKTQGTLERLLEQFRHAGYVRVFYDPEQPARSVLLPGPTFANYSLFLTSIGFFLVG